MLSCGDPGAESGIAEGSPVGNASMDVQVVSPVRQAVTQTIELPVSVEALETTTLLSKVSGYLASIAVDIGDTVSQGQVLAEIDVPEISDELAEAEAELEAKRAGYTVAEAELDRARADLGLRRVTSERMRAVRVEEPDVVPQQALDEAEAHFELAKAAVKAAESRLTQIESQQRQIRAAMNRLKTLIGYSKVRAPFDGAVTKRHVDPGTLLQAATSTQSVQQIVTIASLDRVRLRFDVPESAVPLLEVGDPAAVTVDAIPGRTFEGAVTRFAAALDPATRTTRAEVEMANHDRVLHPGMFGRVTVSLHTRQDVITVPASAIRTEGDSTFVYCVVNGVARRVDVAATVGDGTTVEVSDGLTGDEQVVLSARGPLSDGVPVIPSGNRGVAVH